MLVQVRLDIYSPGCRGDDLEHASSQKNMTCGTHDQGRPPETWSEFGDLLGAELHLYPSLTNSKSKIIFAKGAELISSTATLCCSKLVNLKCHLFEKMQFTFYTFIYDENL